MNALHAYNIYSIRFFSIHVYCIILVVLSQTVSCTEQRTSDKAHLKVLSYLSNSNHLPEKAYKKTFQTHLDQLEKAGKIDQAVQLLEAHGDALDIAFLADSDYVKTTKQFLDKHNSQLRVEQTISLNYYLGSQYDFLGDLEKSDTYLVKTQLSTDNEDGKKLQSFGRTLIAEHYKRSGKYYDAMIGYLQNIAYYEEQKDTINLTITYNNLSTIYKTLKVYDESEKCLQKGLQLAIATKDTINIWTAYINLSRPNELAVNPQKCLKYARLTKHIHDRWSSKTRYHSANTYTTYANAMLLNRQLDSVYFFVELAKKYAEPGNRLKYDLYQMQAETDLISGKPIKNKEILEQEYKAAKQQNDIPVVEMLATILSNNAKRSNDYPNAYHYLAEKYRIRDSSWMNDTKLNLIYLDKKFQLERKEKLIARQQLKIAQNKLFIYAILSVVLILTFTWFIISIRKKRKRSEHEAFIQEQFTFHLLQNTEEERSRIANELHDSVNHELLTIKNALVSGKTVDIEQVAGLIEEVRNISRNLHPAVLETIGLEASIEQLCERLSENGLFTTCEIEYDQPLDKNSELQIYRIIQESLNNTLKHGKAEAAKVNIIQTSTNISVEIKDNGLGFNVEKQINNPRSFGLQSILQRAKSISGTITISSSEKGSIIQFNKAL